MQKNIHRRMWHVTLGAVSILVGTQLAMLGSATASISAGVFELEGDATNDTTVSGIDWDEVYKAQTGDGAYDPNDCPAGASACAWENDGAPNATIFTGGGSKDPNDISAWKWKDQAGGLPDKDNLLHSFAARFTEPGGTDELLFFGSDRFDNSGDAHQAFWFFQNEVLLGSGGKFVDSEGDPATHRDGDLLVISEFSNGGTVSTIAIYKWDSSVPGNLHLLAQGASAKCDGTTTQVFCGIVNPDDDTTSPWPFLDKKGNTAFAQGEFFEGGVNLSHSSIGLGGTCFASFASETRSSTSTTAVLKDFVLGGFANCETTLTTAQSFIPNDSATITVTGGGPPSGKVRFELFKNAPKCDDNSKRVFDQERNLVENDDLTETVSTTNTGSGSPSYVATTTQDLYWKVTFTSTNSNHPSTAPTCSEMSSLTINNSYTPPTS